MKVLIEGGRMRGFLWRRSKLLARKFLRNLTKSLILPICTTVEVEETLDHQKDVKPLLGL